MNYFTLFFLDTKGDNVRGVSNLEVDSSGADSTQILPNLSKEKRRSVSVTRQQKVETAEMVAPNLEQESSDQIQPIISNERKRSVSVTRQDQVEIAENLKNLTNVAKQKIFAENPLRLPHSRRA